MKPFDPSTWRGKWFYVGALIGGVVNAVFWFVFGYMMKGCN